MNTPQDNPTGRALRSAAPVLRLDKPTPRPGEDVATVSRPEDVPWPRPDWSDLNDWYLDYSPAGHRATRYLNDTYGPALVEWHNAGRPTEGFGSALWTEEEATGTPTT